MNPDAEAKKLDMRKLIHVPEVPPEENSFPSVDVVLTLQLEAHEVIDRVSKIKVDPTTGVVYDPVGNPVPETDKKLVARLEATHVDPEQVETELESVGHIKADLSGFFQRFGFRGLQLPIVSELNAGLQPAEVEKQAIDFLKSILDYKYSKWYEAPTLPEDVKCYLGEEQSSAGDIDMIAEKEEESNSRRGSRRGSIHNISKSQFGNPLGNSSIIFKESGEGNMLQVNQRGQGATLTRKPSHYSSGLKSMKKVDAVSAYSGITRKDRYFNKSLDAWEHVFVDYVEEIEKHLTQAVESLDVLEMQFNTSQRGFVKIFRESRDFTKPLQDFIDSYRKFANDNPDALQTDYCKKRLVERIDSVHDKMWKEIEACKQEAIKERDGLLTKSIILSTTVSFCKMYLSVVASELNKLHHLK